jgi:hypothetical protein
MDQKTINELANKIIELRKDAVSHTLSFWKPEAERIINNKSKDIKSIEKALDALFLDFVIFKLFIFYFYSFLNLTYR